MFTEKTKHCNFDKQQQVIAVTSNNSPELITSNKHGIL